MTKGESPSIRWLEHIPRCPCGRRADGILRGDRNQSFGYHCARCAKKRLNASAKARGLPKAEVAP